jgi:Zn-dependent peptidase ImmA (M78 family)
MERTLDEAKELAINVLRRVGLYTAITNDIDTFEVARRLGFELQYNWICPPSLSGCMFKHQYGCKVYLSAKESYVRKQFSCGHEIGHILDDTIDEGLFLCNEDSDSDPERFANWFAAELKMPEVVLRNLVKLMGLQPAVLAKTMKVSDDAMVLRLKELDYDVPPEITMVKSRDLWIYGNPKYKGLQARNCNQYIAEQRAKYKVN